MRRVAVVGTSNIGAIKYAEADISADWPELEVTTYGLPGGRFDAARVNEAGVFSPGAGDDGARKMARRVNGQAQIDLGQFDAVLAIGDTLGMPATLFTAVHYDIVDWPARRSKAALISEPCFVAAMEEAIASRVAHLAKQFGQIRPLFAALAPYPTTAVVPRGEHHQMPYAGMATHPEALRIERLFQDTLTQALADRGISFVPQPTETVAQPFLTKPEYGLGAADFRNPDRILDDHRHMNASFGASLFRAFALALSATPAGGTKTASQTSDQGA